MTYRSMLRGSNPPNFGGMNRRFHAKRVVVVGSHCDVISCNLAQRGVLRGDIACIQRSSAR